MQEVELWPYMREIHLQLLVDGKFFVDVTE